MGARMAARLTVNISDELYAALGALSSKRGLPFNEIIRRAVALYKAYQEELARNGQRLTTTPDGKELVIVPA